MTKAIQQTLRDSKKQRWIALIILSFTMFAGYTFTEIISPLKPILESSYGWNSADFGTVTSFYGFFNVWFFMLIIVGVLLDKFGIRISTISSVVIMILGGTLKYFAFKLDFGYDDTINLIFFEMKTRVFIASIGYALFGVGVEYAGITVSKSVVKWFKGKELALAMGMQVAIARLGSFVPLAFGAAIAKSNGVPFTIFVGIILLLIGLISFFYYNMMDKKLDNQLGEEKKKEILEGAEDEEKFKLADLKVIFSNKGFWLIAILCVLFYSAVFPFYKYGPDLMYNKFGVSARWAGLLPSLVPFGTMLLTPFFGGIYDKKGKGATIMILGAVLLVIVHFIFFLPSINSVVIAFFNVILLGIAFSLVPSAMWPSVPKIIPEKQLGSAYAAIFWVQNVGLWGIPLLVGIVLNSTNPTIVPYKMAIQKGFAKAYYEEVSESPLIDTKNIEGEKLNKDIIRVFSRSVSVDLVSKVISIAPQDSVRKIDTTKLTNEVYQQSKEYLDNYLQDSIDIDKIHEVDEDKENVAFNKLDKAMVNYVAKIVAEKNIKLNYDYAKTWIIFVALTLLALIISLLLKRENKIKGYGLEEPNKEEELEKQEDQEKIHQEENDSKKAENDDKNEQNDNKDVDK